MTPRPAVIFYAEKNRMLSLAVRDVLEFAGWYVKPCSDGCMALAIIESPQHFDLLMLDNELAEFGGLEITRRARKRPHRRQTPILIVSLFDCEGEARLAGADAFLRKPNNLIDLVDTIRRLLAAPDVK